MHVRSYLALGAVLISTACEVPVDTGSSNPDFGVTSVAVQPRTATVVVGDSLQLSASVIMSSNRPPNSISWASGNTGVATVSGTGIVTASTAGSATITATSEGQSASATVAVTTVPVASLSVSPATASVQAGQTMQLTATPKDANGSALSGRTVTWASSNVGVATVSGTGWVSGVAAGSATLTATSEGQNGSASIAVTVPTSAPGTVGDLTVAAVTDSSVTLRFTEVDGGTGTPANYEIRYATGSTLSWGANTTSVSRGTCATPARTGTRAAKCVTSASASAEGALWYTWGNKPGEPANPALSEANGYYQKFSIMYAPGSFANVYNGGSNAQFKMLLNRSDWHYGFEGAWFMTSWGANYGTWPPLIESNGDNCSGMHWNWPFVLQEGVWYDITTWFKRDATTHTGHAKMWVNGVLLTDTDVMPPAYGTSGSPGGLSCLGSDNAGNQQQFEVGATYTQNTVGPFTVYVDDVQAANYPIGAAAQGLASR